MEALARITVLCERSADERSLRADVLAELRRAVPFEAHAWLLTDPRTEVGTAPLAEVPSLSVLPALVRIKYLTSTNRWTTMAAGSVASLLAETGGDTSKSRAWRELLTRLGITDVASLVFRDQFGCWGWLDLWRNGGEFTAEELRLLASLEGPITPALRHSLAATFEIEVAEYHGASEPAVLMLGDDFGAVAQTAPVDHHLRSLLPTNADRPPIPAAAYNVAAQLLAREAGIDNHAPLARTHEGGGVWMTVSAARLSGETGIAVTIEPTSANDRSELFARVIGLSDRESELLGHLVSGSDTRKIADAMFLSEHTVQDHLKSIFAKAGVHNRRLLVARATGMR